MKIYLWAAFTKKANSTKVPDTKLALELDCTILEPCSVLTPSVLLANLGTFSYAYIPTYARYYFISDQIYQERFSRLNMTVDVLASYHTQINQYTCMVGRAFSYRDPDLIDTLYPPEPGISIAESVVNSPFSAPEEYMIQVNSKEGLQLVLMNDTQYRTLCRNLWSTWGSISGMTDIWKNIVDPAQYIVGVQKVAGNPFTFWTQNTKVQGNLPLGDMSIPVGGYYFQVHGEGYYQTDITVPKHPQALANPYTKTSAYSSYSLRIPGCGWIPLDTDCLYNVEKLTIIMRGDPLTGLTKVTINAGNKTIAAVTGQLSAQYSLGSSSVSITGAVGTAVTAIGGIAAGIATGGAAGVAAAAGAASMGVVGAAEVAKPTATMSGAAGGILEVNQPFVAQLKYRVPHSPNPEDQGYPLMKIYQLSLLHGYARTIGAAFSGAMTVTENNMINGYLNGGFYNE